MRTINCKNLLYLKAVFLIVIAAFAGSIGCINNSDAAPEDLIAEEEMEITPVDTNTNEIKDLNKIFPLKIQFKNSEGEVLINNYTKSFEWNYEASERLPLFSWEPADRSREVKEYLYSLNSRPWQSNGTLLSLKISDPLPLGYGQLNVKAVFENGNESYTYQVTWHLVEKISYGFQFSGPYNENFKRVIKTGDGGYLAVGEQQLFPSDPEASMLIYGLLLCKYDKEFNLEWYKRYSGNKGGRDIVNMLDPNKEQADEKIIETADSFIILMSVESDDGMFDGNKGLTDIALLKIDKYSGDIRFCKMIGTPEYDLPVKVIQLPDQDYLVLWTSRKFTDNESICVSRISDKGEIGFEKILPGSTRGGINSILFSDHLLIFHDSAISNSALREIYIKKIDYNANLLLDIRLGEVSNLVGSKKLTNGHCILYGTIGINNWLMEIDETANVIFNKEYANGSGSSVPGNVVELINGNLIISSRAQNNSAGNTWVAELDSNREPIWQKFVGDPDFNGWVSVPFSMNTSDNDIVAFNSIANKDMFLSRVAYGGIVKWTNRIDLPYGGLINSMSADHEGNIILSGHILGDKGYNAVVFKYSKETGVAMN